MTYNAKIVIITKLNSEMKNSIRKLIISSEYDIHEYNIHRQMFVLKEDVANNFILELSKIHPEIKFVTQHWYERQSNMKFTYSYKDGELIKAEIEIDYTFKWLTEIDQVVKDEIQNLLTSNFKKIDKIEIDDEKLSIDVNGDREITFGIVMPKEGYKNLTGKKTDYQLRIKAMKIGVDVYLAVEFDK